VSVTGFIRVIVGDGGSSSNEAGSFDEKEELRDIEVQIDNPELNKLNLYSCESDVI